MQTFLAETLSEISIPLSHSHSQNSHFHGIPVKLIMLIAISTHLYYYISMITGLNVGLLPYATVPNLGYVCLYQSLWYTPTFQRYTRLSEKGQYSYCHFKN